MDQASRDLMNSSSILQNFQNPQILAPQIFQISKFSGSSDFSRVQDSEDPKIFPGPQDFKISCQKVAKTSKKHISVPEPRGVVTLTPLGSGTPKLLTPLGSGNFFCTQ